MSMILNRARAAANSTFAIGGASCFAENFVGNEDSDFRISFLVRNPPIANLQTVIGKRKDRHDNHKTARQSIENVEKNNMTTE